MMKLLKQAISSSKFHSARGHNIQYNYIILRV